MTIVERLPRSWRLASTATAALFLAVGSAVIYPTGHYVAFGVFVGVITCVLAVTLSPQIVTLDSSRLTITFCYLLRTHLSISQATAKHVPPISPLAHGGFGVHYSNRTWWFISGRKPGVEILTRSGRRVIFTTTRSRTLLRALQSKAES